MRNIKKIGLRFLLIVAVIVIFEIGVRYAYESYFASVIYTNREKSQMAGTIDTLYCGTSTIQRGINMDVSDEILSTTSFNIASSDQPVDGTYFLMKDMVKDNPVKTVFLGVSPETMSRDCLATKWKSLVYDRLDGGNDKLAYLLHGVPLEEWPYVTMYSVRVDNYFDFRAVKANIIQKQTEEFRKGTTADKYYRGRGCFGRNKAYEGSGRLVLEKGNSTFKSENINEQYLSYYHKCLEYCKENDINVIMLYPPLTADKIDKYHDITPIHDYYAQIAKEHDVPFWDFNYYKDIKTTFLDEHFEDDKHLNGEGGKVFAKELAKIYQNYMNGEDVSKYFAKECPYYSE